MATEQCNLWVVAYWPRQPRQSANRGLTLGKVLTYGWCLHQRAVTRPNMLAREDLVADGEARKVLVELLGEGLLLLPALLLPERTAN